jgi:hypothetical protein
VCGDANGNGYVSVADAKYVLAFVFESGPPPDPLEAGDANCSGTPDIGDAVYLIQAVFLDGPAPCCP